MSDPSVFEQRSRPELIAEARSYGIERPERMTRAELRDEILRRSKTGSEQAEARGLFGVARSMLASVVESGLNLPDAAAVIRGAAPLGARPLQSTPVATVTLAEIYAAQGHKKRALFMLDEVLEQEPDHEVALRLRRDLGSNEPQAPAAPATPPPSPLVETIGEEIQTGAPPVAQEARSAEAVDEEPTEVPAVRIPPVVAVEELPVPEARGEGSAEPARADSSVEAPAQVVTREPVLVLAQTEAGIGLYWELGLQAIERCGIDGSEGYPVVRLVAFVPRGGNPEREERTLPLEVDLRVQTEGVLRLAEWGSPRVVRAAVGWETGDAFLPLAVGRHFTELEQQETSRDLVTRAAQALG